MSKPHYFLNVIAEHGFSQGSAICDLQCNACGTQWSNARMADLEDPPHRMQCCDDCAEKMKEAERIAEKIWLSPGWNGRSWYSERTRNHGLFGIRDDVFAFLTRGTPLRSFLRKHYMLTNTPTSAHSRNQTS